MSKPKVFRNVIIEAASGGVPLTFTQMSPNRVRGTFIPHPSDGSVGDFEEMMPDVLEHVAWGMETGEATGIRPAYIRQIARAVAELFEDRA